MSVARGPGDAQLGRILLLRKLLAVLEKHNLGKPPAEGSAGFQHLLVSEGRGQFSLLFKGVRSPHCDKCFLRRPPQLEMKLLHEELS